MGDEFNDKEQMNTVSVPPFFGLDWVWKMGAVDSRLGAVENGLQHISAKLEVAEAD